MIDVKKFGKVAVLYGGTSAERDVSLMSGATVLNGLKTAGIDAHGVDVGADIVSVLQKGKFDRAFPILHGRGGEDGSIQAVLEFLNLPYCGSGVAASALAMDKLRSKWIWQANHLPTPKFLLVRTEQDLDKVKDILTLPLAVKPIREGSSLGMTKLGDWADLNAAFKKAQRYDHEVLLEEWVEGDEFTVGIVGNTILPAVKISTPREFYDYEAKYVEHTTIYDCPSGISDDEEKILHDLSWQAFRTIGCKDWGRMDFMRDVNGQFWAIEMNTLPGMTETSLVPIAAKAKGMLLEDLLLQVLAGSS